MSDSIRTMALDAFGKRNEREPTRQEVDSTLAMLGEGLDHDAGERAWIARPHEVHSSAAVAALLVTDRRLAGVKLTGGTFHLTGAHAGQEVPGWARFSIPYAAIASLDRMLPLVGTEHRVRLADGGVVRVPRAGAWSKLRRFIAGVLSIPPESRTPARPAPLDEPSPWARVVTHLETLRARGDIDGGTVADFVARIERHRRAVRYGIAGLDGGFATALPADDLACVLANTVGAPIRVTTEPPCIELPLARQGDDVGVAIANAVGLASLAVFGFGVLVRSAPMPRGLRVVVRDPRGAAGYALFTDRGLPLSAVRPDMALALVRAIVRAEADLLVRRAAHGWGMSAAELMRVRPEDVLERYRITSPELRAQDLPGPP